MLVKYDLHKKLFTSNNTHKNFTLKRIKRQIHANHSRSSLPPDINANDDNYSHII